LSDCDNPATPAGIIRADMLQPPARPLTGESAPSSGTSAIASERWDQLVGGMACIPSLLKARGVDPAVLLARAGLAADALDAPDRRAPFQAIARLLTEAARETACPHFGLLVGQRYAWDDIGLPGQLALNSSTLREALETFTVYQRLNSQGGTAYLTRYGDSAALGFAVFHPHIDQLATAYDVALASLATAIRALVGAGWNPDEVLLPRARPLDGRPYRDLFRCTMVFDSDRAELRFAAHVLDRRLPGADPARKRALESGVPRAESDDLLVRLYRSLRLLISSGGAHAGLLAQQFAMHRRTLERRLKAQGTTFQSVLDDMRHEAARQLLSDTDLPSSRVGAAVGYSEPASFTRAFRRWSGLTPSQWRAQRAATGATIDSAATVR
jgi:AraC-like DNA-binding protein